MKRKNKLNSPAKITIVRRESSGLHSFEAWDFYLNGESIGSVKDGGSVTVDTKQRNNVLEAKDNKGAGSLPLSFIAQSGGESEVVFNNGGFHNPQGMNVVLDTGETGGFAKIANALTSKKWFWVSWIFLAGYFVGVYFLSRGDFLLAVVLSILPVVPLSIAARYANSEMFDYLYFNHPQALGRITSEQNGRFFMSGDILFFDSEVVDPDYEEYRRRYKRILWTLFFCGAACCVTFFCAGTAVVNPPAEPAFTIPPDIINSWLK